MRIKDFIIIIMHAIKGVHGEIPFYNSFFPFLLMTTKSLDENWNTRMYHLIAEIGRIKSSVNKMFGEKHSE